MKVKCLALRPFLFQMTVLAIGEPFSTTKGHATDLVADGLAKYATDSDAEDPAWRGIDLADDAQLDASDGGAPAADTEVSDESAPDQPADKDSSDGSVAANEKNETQEKELTDDSDNAGSSKAPAAPVRKRRGSASKPAD